MLFSILINLLAVIPYCFGPSSILPLRRMQHKKLLLLPSKTVGTFLDYRLIYTLLVNGQPSFSFLVFKSSKIFTPERVLIATVVVGSRPLVFKAPPLCESSPSNTIPSIHTNNTPIHSRRPRRLVGALNSDVVFYSCIQAID